MPFTPEISQFMHISCVFCYPLYIFHPKFSAISFHFNIDASNLPHFRIKATHHITNASSLISSWRRRRRCKLWPFQEEDGLRREKEPSITFPFPTIGHQRRRSRRWMYFQREKEEEKEEGEREVWRRKEPFGPSAGEVAPRVPARDGQPGIQYFLFCIMSLQCNKQFKRRPPSISK